MASRKITLAFVAVMATVAVVALLPATASAASYRVGDGTSGSITALGQHARSCTRRGKLGDRSVVLVDERSFVSSNAPTLSSGDDKVALTKAGQWFFIFGVEGHCQSGMKLAVNVR